jgi:hypothetical protein
MQSISKTKHHMMSLWFLLPMLVISSCLFTINSYGANKMEPLYNINEATELKPQEFNPGGGLFGTGWMTAGAKNISLFPVPQANTVGTNSIHNAITLISFPGKRMSFDNYFKNAVDDIRGSGIYIPVISKDVIGLGQVRRFMLFDFKKKIHRKFRIAMSISEDIKKIAIADARRNLFLFEIEGHTGKSPDAWDTRSSLLLMDLYGEEPKLVKEIPIGDAVVWSVVGDKNFLRNFSEKKPGLQVYNMSLEPANHPLSDVINKHKDKINFMRIYAHPVLPFAILTGGKSGVTFISWRNDKNNDPYTLLSSAKQFSFSPDGKWVTFKKKINSNTERTYLMPVSEKYPNYLGSPIMLLNDYFNDNKSAWTTNPTSFVGSSGEELYRWDLDNQDFPEKGKMSFHDYVVREDLKKLTREKRQGLGK